MSFPSWLHNFRSTRATGRGQSDHGRRGSLRAATRGRKLEFLEDRCLLSFSPAVSYSVGTNPQAVVAADFNHDGRLDLAVANVESNSVSVLLGTGDGSFQPARVSTTGARPLSVAVGDFNRDGNLDLATANQGDNNVSLLSGNGDGTFRAESNIDIGSMPSSVAVGDFNGDGKLDLGVISNVYDDWYYTYSGEANVLLGNGDGSFSAPITSSGDSGFYYLGVVTDLNGDRKPDMVAVKGDDGQVVVMQGNGDGTFQPARISAIGANPVSVAAGDVNGDAKIDVVTANVYSNNVTVLLGNGVGGFASSQNYAAATRPESVVLGDFNRDGKLDIATANSTDSSVSILRGLGNGTFSTAENFAVGPSPSAVAAGDFNGDGWLDATTANATGNSASVLLNNQSWPFVPPTVSVSDATVTEGNTGTVNATFTLTLAYASNVDVTVHYATADGSAVSGSDYTAASGVVTIPAGQTSAMITVAVKGDRLPETDETFAVNLSAAINATIADGQGIGTILDDEPRISISDVSKREGKKNQTTQFTFTVTLSVPYDQPVTMSFSTVDGTATTSDNDYVARTGTLTFAPGETTKTITIEVPGDNKRESNESFFLDLSSNSSNSVLDKKRGIGTILNDD